MNLKHCKKLHANKAFTQWFLQSENAHYTLTQPTLRRRVYTPSFQSNKTLRAKSHFAVNTWFNHSVFQGHLHCRTTQTLTELVNAVFSPAVSSDAQPQ